MVVCYLFIYRPSYLVPNGVVSGIKLVHPMFRGFAQQVNTTSTFHKVLNFTSCPFNCLES